MALELTILMGYKNIFVAIQKKQIIRRGDGEEVRQYIHAYDAVVGFRKEQC